MKSYSVIGVDGQRYGPTALPTLVQWTREGRIVGGTLLIDNDTNQSLAASTLPEIRAALFERAAPAASPAGAETVWAPRTRTRAAEGRGAEAAGAGMAVSFPPVVRPKSRVVAGVLGLCIGWTGAHRFYLGYTGMGVLILLSNALCGLGVVWGIVEGILCLIGAMRDSEGRPLSD